MRYIQFTKEEWGRLRAATPMTLTEGDLAELHGINERISLEEVALVYLPLSRLLNLYVAATRICDRPATLFLEPFPHLFPTSLQLPAVLPSAKARLLA
jgi:Panthothenate kinase